MNIIESTSQFFQLCFTAIVAVILGGLTAKLLPNRRPNTLRVEIPLLVFLTLGLVILSGDSILQVFWNVNNSLALTNELALLIRSILSFLVINMGYHLVMNIAQKTGWLKVITAFALIALSTSFIEWSPKLPTISNLQSFWLCSYALCVTILFIAYAVVRIGTRSTRRTPSLQTEGAPDPDEYEETD